MTVETVCSFFTYDIHRTAPRQLPHSQSCQVEPMEPIEPPWHAINLLFSAITDACNGLRQGAFVVTPTFRKARWWSLTESVRRKLRYFQSAPKVAGQGGGAGRGRREGQQGQKCRKPSVAGAGYRMGAIGSCHNLQVGCCCRGCRAWSRCWSDGSRWCANSIRDRRRSPCSSSRWR